MIQPITIRFRMGLLAATMLGATFASSGGAKPQAQPAAPSEERAASTAALPVARDKMIYLFTRRPGIDREEYQRVYRELHSPLGMQYFTNIIGYTVDFVTSQGGPDALAEVWVPSAADQMNPAKALKPYLPEDMPRVRADEKARAGNRMEGFIVDEQVVRGKPVDAELGRTPGVKIIWLYRRGDKVPAPPAAAWRVVDNRVKNNPVGAAVNGVWKEGSSDIVLIRMAWANDLAGLGTLAPGALVTTEWRFRPSPWK